MRKPVLIALIGASLFSSEKMGGQPPVSNGAVPLAEPVVLGDETYRVYADPAGHPFCLVQLDTI